MSAPLHPAADSLKPPPELKQYHLQTSFSLFDVPDHMHSVIGRALLEWNSRNGVSYIVWHTISTARVHCPHCNLVRSFDGDKDHRRSGECGSAGLNNSEAGDKGKGRAVDDS